MHSNSPKTCIVILNYNGADLLPECLPSIVEAAKQSSFPVRVCVLDNLSTDNGLDYVKTHFPEVEIFNSKENKVLCSYNDYLAVIDDDIAILLNNDIRVAPDFIDPLIQKFQEDPECFLAAPRVMTFDGTEIEAARSRSGVKFGFFWCNARYPGYEKEYMIPSETDSSGFGAFSRKKFLAVGGYDMRYFPGIMEDVDLCYHAKLKGYHLYYEPSSVVYHMGQASFKKKFGAKGTSIIAHRNTFLFMWKNFKGAGLWLQHLFFLPLRLVFAAMRGNTAMLAGFKEALKKP